MKRKAIQQVYLQKPSPACKILRGGGSRITPNGGTPTLEDLAEWKVVANPYDTDQLGPVAKRIRKVREQMAKKVSKHEKPYVYRLGYNHCIAQFAGREDYPALSGSSLNRKKIKPKKREPNQDAERRPHILSARSRGKVKDKATAFFRSIKGDRIFLTLTFIQHVEDDEACRILNKFLTVVRKEKPGLQFLWVAEHQPENPMHTIHFHILMNKKLPVKRYNALWVMQQYNDGLIGHTAEGEEIPIEEISERYKHDMNSAFKKRDPHSVMAALNPLDVRKAYGVSSLANYLTKYITKQTEDDPFWCLNWHCSRRVSKLFTKQVVSPSTFRHLLTFANYRVDTETGEMCWPKIIKKEFFTMVYVNNKRLPLRRLRLMEQTNYWIMGGMDPGITRLDDDLFRKLFCTDMAGPAAIIEPSKLKNDCSAICPF